MGYLDAFSRVSIFKLSSPERKKKLNHLLSKYIILIFKDSNYEMFPVYKDCLFLSCMILFSFWKPNFNFIAFQENMHLTLNNYCE